MKTILSSAYSLKAAYLPYFKSNSSKVSYIAPLSIQLFGCSTLILCLLASSFHNNWSHFIITFPYGFLYVPLLSFLYDKNIKELNSKHKSIFSLIPITLFCLSYMIISSSESTKHQYNVNYAMLVHFLSFLYLAGYVVFLKSEAMYNRKNNKLLVFCLYLAFILLFSIQIVQMYIVIEIKGLAPLLNTFIIPSKTMLSLGLILIIINFRSKNKKENLDKLENIKFNKSILNQTEQNQYIEHLNRIEEFIKSQKYLQQDLNKEQFCNDLEIPISLVGPLLKKEYGLGFNGFLNQQRLNYVVELLKTDSQSINIDELAENCGFKSRATFYRNFKTTYHCTPHQFRTKINQN